MPKRCHIVVACCEKLGIGLNGELPWKLRADMQHFRKLTMTAVEGKQNAVIMGRKTYFSIPERFRPMKDRVNIVLSRDKNLDLPSGVHHAENFHTALEMASSEDLNVDNVYIIGGSTVYKEAFNSEYLHRIYLTKIYKSMECDVFLPEANLPQFKRVQVEGIPSALQTEKDIEYEFQVYQRRDQQSIDVSIMSAVCMSNRGIGLNGVFPWPSIPTDFQYYTKLITSTSKPDSRIAIITGTRTYQDFRALDLKQQCILNIVLSRSLDRVANCPAEYVVPSIERAVTFCTENKAIEKAWVLGGSEAYKAALTIPECTQCYLTEIEGEYESDTYFPEFHHLFTRTSKGETITENGVSYRFCVYERKDYSTISDTINAYNDASH